MALSNEQYDTIMREYSRRQADTSLTMADRRQTIYDRIPRIQKIDEETAALSVSSARRLLDGDDAALSRLKEQLARLSKERARLLVSAGFPEDYLDPVYFCPDCRDTGYVGNQKCHCFRQAEIDLLYAQSNLRDILKEENFAAFREDYYSDRVMDPDTGCSSLALARTALRAAQGFVRNFGREYSNLFLYGSTGIGKTFLINCIARELLDSSWSVLYFSSSQLFEQFSRRNFSRAEEGSDLYRHIFECDLLIIDDLGTELVNAFVSSQLFLLVNERLLRKKPTVISTNLTPEHFMSTYSERIFSRISSNYTMLKLYGEDIRLRKKILSRTSKKK